MGKYELGRTLGEGTFAKVKFARNIVNGENVAIKIIDKEKVLRNKMIAHVIIMIAHVIIMFPSSFALLFLSSHASSYAT